MGTAYLQVCKVKQAFLNAFGIGPQLTVPLHMIGKSVTYSDHRVREGCGGEKSNKGITQVLHRLVVLRQVDDLEVVYRVAFSVEPYFWR